MIDRNQMHFKLCEKVAWQNSSQACPPIFRRKSHPKSVRFFLLNDFLYSLSLNSRALDISDKRPKRA